MEQSHYPGDDTRTMYTPTSDERTFAILSHVLTIVAPIIAPLVIYLIKKDESNYVAEHAKESLNFQITALIVCIGLMITIVGFFLLPLVGILVFVAVIIATIKASEGKIFR